MNLFGTREGNEGDPLNGTRTKAYHHTVAQFLFTGIRFRNYMQTAIAFLTTQVRNLDEDNRKKLQRLLRYLKRTIKLPLILRYYGVNVLKWWVHASYVTHDDIRGHTGGTMSMKKNGRG